MNTIAGFGLCTLTDQELLEKVDKKTDEIYKSCEINRKYPETIKLPNVLSRHIPAKPNDDYDLLIGELVLRFQNLIKKALGDEPKAGDEQEGGAPSMG